MDVSTISTRILEQLPKNKPIRGVMGAIKQAVDLIRNRGRWSFFHKIGTVSLVASYSTGTVTTTTTGGATSLAGTLTVWTSAMTGRKIRIGTDPVDYTFTYVSGTTATISPALIGSDQTGATYVIYQDTYSLASDVQNVIAFYDVTNKTTIPAIESSFGQQFNNWFASTYGYAGSVFQFARDSSQYYQIVFAPPVDTVALIRYLYYRLPTKVTGPASITDMPAEMDECVIQGALWRVMKTSGLDGWQDEKALFNELLEGRWRDDRAFLSTAVPMLRWDNTQVSPWGDAGRRATTLVSA